MSAHAHVNCIDIPICYILHMEPIASFQLPYKEGIV